MSTPPPALSVWSRLQVALRAAMKERDTDRAGRLLREAQAIEAALDITPPRDDA